MFERVRAITLLKNMNSDFERKVTWEAPALLPDCSPMVASLPCLKEEERLGHIYKTNGYT